MDIVENIDNENIEIISTKGLNKTTTTTTTATTSNNRKIKNQLNQAIEIKYDNKFNNDEIYLNNHNNDEISSYEDGASIIIGNSKNNSAQYSNSSSNRNSILFTGSSSCGGTGNIATHMNSNNSIDLCMMWLQKSITVNTIQEHVCERILKLPDKDFQFYLPQIIQVCIVNYHSVESVVTMLLEKCRVSIIIAAQSFFLIESIVRDNNPQTFNNAKYLWKRCEMASIGLSSESSFPQQYSNSNSSHNNGSYQSYSGSSSSSSSQTYHSSIISTGQSKRDNDQLSDSSTIIIDNWTEKIHTYQQQQQQQQQQNQNSLPTIQEQQDEIKSLNSLSKSTSEFNSNNKNIDEDDIFIESEFEKLTISNDNYPQSPNSTIYGSQVINNYPNNNKPMLASTSKNTYTFFFDLLQVEVEDIDGFNSIESQQQQQQIDFKISSPSSSNNNFKNRNNTNSNNNINNNNKIEDVISTSPSNMSGFLYPPKSPSTSSPTSPALSRSTSFDNSSNNNNNNSNSNIPPLNNSNKQVLKQSISDSGNNGIGGSKKILKKFNYQPFYSEIHFINILSKIGGFLLTIPMVTDKAKQRDMRNVTLKVILKQLNDQLFGSNGENMIFLPVYPPFLVLSICHEEAVCLNSRDRIPFLIVLEVKKSMDSQLYQDPNYQKETDELFEEEEESGEEGVTDNEEEEEIEIEEEVEIEEEIIVNNSNSSGDNNFDIVNENDDGDHQEVFSPSSSLSSNSSQLGGDGSANNIITKKTKRIIKKVINITKKIPKRKKKVRDLSNPIYAIFGELWKQKENRIYKSSMHSDIGGWGLISFIVKSGDDLRQEQFAMQLITQFHRIFRKSKLPLWLRPYLVIATGHDSGLIETVPDTISLDNLKKKDTAFTTLYDYFIRAYGDINSNSFKKAQAGFIESLAGYSLVCYFLQIKDRHNGNILIDTRGHLIHIDYGFLLSISPGSMNFEKAPFKLTKEFLDLMGGINSDRFKYFTYLLVAGFVEVRKHFEEFQMMLDLLLPHSNLTFFVKGGPNAISSFKERFKLDLKSIEECEQYIMELVNLSINNWTTSSYDSYQYLTNGINI